MDEKLMVVYLQKIWKPYVNRVAKEVGLTDTASLLVLDSFKAHTTDAVQNTLEEINTKAPVIPRGLYFKSAAP